ncbi:MAG: hypothetical protein CMF48_04165 [Legionellales bacterium]|nr:hypothetical protein [Legionellales bacterium]|tara:strand:- start:1088 stop:1282 length:195 start_codon:yes stop_codon:yes gene_type:complete
MIPNPMFVMGWRCAASVARDALSLKSDTAGPFLKTESVSKMFNQLYLLISKVLCIQKNCFMPKV